MFTRKYWIIIREGNFEPGAKKITKLIGKFTWIGFSNSDVLVVRKREIDFHPFEGIYTFAG